jgi:cell wall-associated NlpC family hydrolase
MQLNSLTSTLATALLLALGGCSTAPPAPGSNTYEGVPRASPGIARGPASDAAVYAVGLVGTPYRWGGNTPSSGFDCSGLIGHVYRVSAGVSLPRTVAQLQSWGEAVSRSDLRTGDLVFFGPRGAASHAGIYVGASRFVHAPSTGGKVRLARLDSTYWSTLQSTFRRP